MLFEWCMWTFDISTPLLTCWNLKMLQLVLLICSTGKAKHLCFSWERNREGWSWNVWNCRQTHDTVPRYIQVQCQTFDAPVIEGENDLTSLLQGFTFTFLLFYFSKSKLLAHSENGCWHQLAYAGTSLKQGNSCSDDPFALKDVNCINVHTSDCVEEMPFAVSWSVWFLKCPSL